MLWAQHADASTTPKRTERSKVICLCVIVFDCWQLYVCVCVSLFVSKTQAFVHQVLFEVDIVTRNKNTKRRHHSNWLSCCVLATTPQSHKALAFWQPPSFATKSQRLRMVPVERRENSQSSHSGFKGTVCNFVCLQPHAVIHSIEGFCVRAIYLFSCRAKIKVHQSLDQSSDCVVALAEPKHNRAAGISHDPPRLLNWCTEQDQAFRVRRGSESGTSLPVHSKGIIRKVAPCVKLLIWSKCQWIKIVNVRPNSWARFCACVSWSVQKIQAIKQTVNLTSCFSMKAVGNQFEVFPHSCTTGTEWEEQCCFFIYVSSK